MIELAKAHCINLIFSFFTTAKDYQWNPRMYPDLMVLKLNSTIKKYFTKNKVII